MPALRGLLPLRRHAASLSPASPNRPRSPRLGGAWLWLLILLPLLAGGGGWLGGRFSGPASQLHPRCQPRAALRARARHAAKDRRPHPRRPGTWNAPARIPKDLLAEAAAIRHKFRLGGWLFGAWVGLVIGVKLISLSVRRQRTDYEPDRGACLSCARCLEYCPNELTRRGAQIGVPTRHGTLQVK